MKIIIKQFSFPSLKNKTEGRTPLTENKNRVGLKEVCVIYILIKGPLLYVPFIPSRLSHSFGYVTSTSKGLQYLGLWGYGP